ncbi:MAG: hypothetical protein IKV10_02770, partial [Alphaproteobacteria bacterium]|nr:hypothetical protein [Alphaproteobacteria bacterium]
IDTRFCDSSPIRKTTVENGYHMIFTADEYKTNRKYDDLTYDKSELYYKDNPCLHIGYAPGYFAENNQCVDINSVTSRMCQPGKPKTNDWPIAKINSTFDEDVTEIFNCDNLNVGETKETSGCLKTSANTVLYCIADVYTSYFATPETRKKTCRQYDFDESWPDFTLNSTTANYWCTDSKWQKRDITQCNQRINGINDFTDCTGRDNCIKKIYTSATLTTPLAFTNNVHRHTNSLSADLCYRYVCADGYQLYTDLCVSKEDMENTKEFCSQTGGQWIEDTQTCFCEPNKNLKNPDGGLNSYCQCKDKDHALDLSNPSNGCEKIDSVANKEACDAADNATWVPASTEDETGKCVCTQAGHYWQWNIDTQTGRCKMYDNYEPCINAENTRWNTTTNECECTDGGQEFRDGQCVDTQETKNINANIAAIEIANTIVVLDRIKQDLDKTKSKWKNAEGKFNTARLASDATAGIVLGTTSALITSKLVKKHQVQDGFEDIQCTIGGQTVADWGDEFTIGIQ